MNQVNMALEPLRAFLQQLGEFLPRLFLAVVIAVVGWLIAKALRLAVVKGLRTINFHVLTERAGMDSFLQQGGSRTDVTDVVGALVYWLVILAALILAFNTLNLVYVTDILGRVALFIPRVIVALVIIAFGAYFARFIEASVDAYARDLGFAEADLLGRLARYAVLAFVLLIAFEQLDIGGNIIRHSFLIILAGIVLALALAFGLGGRAWAAMMLERWWPHRSSADDDPTRRDQ